MNTIKQKTKNGNTQYLLVDEKGKTLLNFSKVEEGVTDVEEIEGNCFEGNYYDEDGAMKSILFDNDGNVIHKHLAQSSEYIEPSGHYLLLVDADKVDPYKNEGDTLWCVVDDMGNYIVPPEVGEMPKYLDYNKIYVVEDYKGDKYETTQKIYLNGTYIGDWADEQSEDPYNGALSFKSKKKFGLLKEGKIILESKYDEIIWEVFNSKGGIRTKPKISEYLPDGIAILKLNGKYSLCYLTDMKFDNAGFSDARVMENGNNLTEDISKLKAELDNLHKMYGDTLRDGDKKSAGEIKLQLRDVRDRLNEAEYQAGEYDNVRKPKLIRISDKSYHKIYQVDNEILGFVGFLCSGDDNSKYDFYYELYKMGYETIDAPNQKKALVKINQFLSKKTSLEDILNP